MFTGQPLNNETVRAQIACSTRDGGILTFSLSMVNPNNRMRETVQKEKGISIEQASNFSRNKFIAYGNFPPGVVNLTRGFIPVE